jgi:hypothetical protein
MSLSAKRTGLIVISALFFTISCREKEKIGLDPGHKIGVIYTEIFSINTQAYLKNDSVNISKSGFLLVGGISDPEFGDISAEAYTQLLQANENTAANFTSIDSVVLRLTIEKSPFTYTYGDTMQNQTINVYRLTDDLSADVNYFTVHPAIAKESSFIDNDTPFQLRASKGVQKIYLDNSFGSDVLTIIGSGISNSTFKTLFKGIALVPKDNNGAIFRFTLTDNNNPSKITIYYKDGAESKSRDLVMSTSGARFTRIIADRSATPVLSGLTNNSGDQVDAAGNIYVQSGLGIGTKIFFPGLDSLRKDYPNVAVNIAELIIEVDPATLTNNFKPVGLLHLIKLDKNGNPSRTMNPDGSYRFDIVQKEFQDVNGTIYPLEVTYNSSDNKYSFNISSYIHAVLVGAIDNHGLLISSHPSVSSSSVNRFVGGSGTSTVKLRIYFTNVK